MLIIKPKVSLNRTKGHVFVSIMGHLRYDTKYETYYNVLETFVETRFVRFLFNRF